MKRKSPARQPIPGKQTSPVRDRRLVHVNDAPLRKRAATEFKRAMAKLEKARIELRRFEREDGPAFGRWMAAAFGALQTVSRENARLISEQRALVEEIEMEMMWGPHRNPRKAYAAVMKRRENAGSGDDSAEAQGRDPRQGGEPDPEGWEGMDGFDPFDGSNLSEEKRRRMFESYLEFIGIEQERLSEEEYENLFAQYQVEQFGDVIDGDPFLDCDDRIPAKKCHLPRVKEIYRILVRRLHPDLRADRDSEVSAIWHEVQEAYEAGNVDRLETLLALTEMENGGDGGQSSISQMRSALGELKRSLGAIQRSIRQAKQDPAWNFQSAGAPVVLEKRVRREIESHIAEQRWILAELKRLLDDWSRPWKAPVRAKAVPRKESPAPSHPRRPTHVQTEFF